MHPELSPTGFWQITRSSDETWRGARYEWLVEVAPPPPQRSGELGYQPGLDTLRAAAISLILSYHIFRWPSGGYMGVDLFFVLSGFLITTLLLEEHARHGSVSLKLFYARRALRLFPALCAFLPIAVLGFAAAGSGHDVGKLLKGTLWGVTYTTNIADGLHAGTRQFGHLWSLAVEEQFYLLWPPLLLLAFRWSRSPRVTAAAALTLASAIALARAKLLPAVWQNDARFDGILLGCALALAYSQAARARWRPLLSAPAIALAAAGAAALSVAADSSWIRYGGTLLLAICAAPLLLALLEHPHDPRWLRGARAALTVTPILFLGRISYALYLWHFAIARWASNDRVTSRIGVNDARLLALATSIAAATCSYYLIERPFLRRKWRLARISTHDTSPAPLPASVAFAPRPLA